MRLDKDGNVYTTTLDEMDIAIGADGYVNLFENGDFEKGTNEGFTWGTCVSSDKHSGVYSLEQGGIDGNKGSGRQGSVYIPVDIAQTYQMTVWAKTTVLSALSKLAGGHMGYACYDKNKAFISLMNDGGYGHTVLTRAATAGDTTIYVADASGWNNESHINTRIINVYPPTHPDFSTPYEYTRFGYGSAYISFAAGGLTDLGGGEWSVDSDSGYSSGQWPSLGYATPIGTPVCNGRHGGSYNYALGAPNYPEEWTRYTVTVTPPNATPSSGAPFRYGTEYIKFLMLENYNIRSDAGAMAKFLLDDIQFYCTSVVQPAMYAPGHAIGAADILYVQELIELGEAPTAGVVAYLDSAHRFTAVNQIVEE